MAMTGVALGTAFGAGLANVVSTGATFEQTMVNAAAKFDIVSQSQKEFIALSKAAQEQGARTEFTATQAAEALQFLGLAGFEVNEAIAALPGVIDLATVAQTELAQATDIATDTMGIFGLNVGTAEEKAKNLVKVSDLLAKTSTSANTSMEQMFEALKQGGPVAKAAGVSMLDTSVILGVLANAGIKGSDAGTGLKRVILGLAAPTPKATAALKKLGVTTTEVTKTSKALTGALEEAGIRTTMMEKGVKKLRGPLAIMEDLQTAVSKLQPADRPKFLDAIFGKIGIASSVNLIDNAGKSIDELKGKIADYAGTVSKLADFQRKTLIGNWNALNSIIESVKIRATELSKGGISVLINKIRQWIKVNDEWLAQGVGDTLVFITKNIRTIISVIAGTGGLIVALTTLSFALKAVGFVVTLLNALMAANPVVLMTMAFLALASAAVWVAFNMDKVEASLRPLLELITDIVEKFKELMTLQSFTKPVSQGAASYQAALTGFGGGMPRATQPAGVNALGTGTLNSVFGAGGTNSTPSPSSISQGRADNTANISGKIEVEAKPGTSAEITGQNPSLIMSPSGDF